MIIMKRILPAYPLWIIDPMFSVWSKNNALNGGDTVFWTGLQHRAYGFVRFNGKTYCFLGKRDDAVLLKQTSVNVTAFSTDYTFECEEFVLEVKFISPLLPDDLKTMSCPVCYTSYEVKPRSNELPSDFSVALVLDESFCYNREKARVIGGVLPCGGYEAAYFTRYRNCVLSDTSDNVAPDWGSTYVTGEESFFVTDSAVNLYVADGRSEYIRLEHENNYILSVNRTQSGYFMTAFDDFVSIFYFGEWLKSYFFKDGGTIIDALNFSRSNYENIIDKCIDFDNRLKKDCKRIGEGYYTLACAALRQSVGAHKLVENKRGQLLFLSKECDSNGCIGTVDVSYPSTPLYLLYNPKLVNAMMNGIFEFARMPVWTYDFAPHDIGVYPWCCGQSYSVNMADDKYGCGFNKVYDIPNTKQMLYLRPAASNVYSMEKQMPVEECGNMLIMTAAAMVAGGGNEVAESNFDLLSVWVTYLEKYGLKPETQLCTDDFAGHLANNINLAIKALVGIESFSVICERTGRGQLAKEYFKKATDFASELKKLAGDGVWALAYGQEGTYSLKYNILFDKLFGFNLIGQEICERETEHYMQKNNRFGVPLDTREDYTKSDWILWVATLTDNSKKAKALYDPIIEYLATSPSRVPFGDWYCTKKGVMVHFMNRTVQGGIFAPLLKLSGKMKIR